MWTDADIDELLEDLEMLAFEGRLASARSLLETIESQLAPDDAERLYARALFEWARWGPGPKARRYLEQSIAAAPEFSDARHALGRLAEATGDFDTQRAQWLEVLRLDEAEERPERASEELDAIEAIAERVLADIPEGFRERLHHVAVVLEPRPHRALVEEGFDPRALGLFEGHEDAMRHEAVGSPTRVVLFYDNLLDSFGDDEARLEEEIETTLLHEIGHFFGLDEDGVAALGLA